MAQRKEIAALPPKLRDLLDAELAAGNEVIEVSHSFPAPPIGACVRLTRAITTRTRVSRDGIDFREGQGSLYGGLFTDENRIFYLLEPALPPPPEPDMDAIRAAHLPSSKRAAKIHAAAEAAEPLPLTPLRQFERSMVIDYEKWHDGVGYDLSALAALTPEDQGAIERRIIGAGVKDWRDVEALALLDTPAARAALRTALQHSDPQVRSAVMRAAPALITDSERSAMLIKGLKTATFFGGLSQTLDDVADFHPPEIVAELFRGALDRDGDIAVHFAAMLCFVHHQATEPFDMEQRPFFLRFNTNSRPEREVVFRELCVKVGANPAHYLPPLRSASVASSDPSNPLRFRVEIDRRGETVTYVESRRVASVACAFSSPPRILVRSMTTWWHVAEHMSVPMSAEEKALVLARMIEVCRDVHGLTDITFAS